MSALREAAQQALEVLEDWDSPVALPAIIALRAALAQEQAEPAQVAGLREKVGLAYGYLWCVNNEPGAPHQMPPERMAYEARKLLRDTMTHHERGEFINRVLPLVRGVSAELTSTALAQEQAEPKPMSPEQWKMWEELAAMPQQAEPLNLSDRAVQRRLAAQWGYVPAAQAEPAQEPVACNNTFSCRCPKHFASQQSEQRPKRVLTAVWRDRAQRVEAQRDALLEALKALLARDEKNTCRHEETHRGGAIWEICDSCGAMWADDEGGKPKWEEPKEWTQARVAIAAVEGEKT